MILLENGSTDGTLPTGQIYWATDNGAVGLVDLTLMPGGVNSLYTRPILEKAFGPIKRFSTIDLNAVLSVFTAVRNAYAATLVSNIPNTPGAFTSTDRAMLDDIATKAELANALTGTVNSVNSQAALNRDSIIAQCHN